MAVAGAKDVSSLKQLKTLVVLKSNVRREREQDVRYIELPAKNEFKEEEENNMKTLTFEDLSE